MYKLLLNIMLNVVYPNLKTTPGVSVAVAPTKQKLTMSDIKIIMLRLDIHIL